jgi:hypothetical protein
MRNRGDEDDGVAIERRSTDSRVFWSVCSLAVTVALQIAGGIWWAANISSDMRHNTEAINTVSATAYSKVEARADFRNVDTQMSEVVRRIALLERAAARRTGASVSEE